MAHKSRKQKAALYEERYGDIPRDYEERLAWLYDKLHINEGKGEQIITKYNAMKQALYYTTIFIVLYEEPEGAPRPRFRWISRENLSIAAKANPGFVHVYSITGAEDQKFMHRLVEDEEFQLLDHIIYTPCDVIYTTFHKTPSSFNAVDTYLAELGMHRPTTKPDWDNLGKKYSDMSNSNLWLDDTLVISGTVNKFYSVLPRVEIQLMYLNTLYTRQQANAISKRYGEEVSYFQM